MENNMELEALILSLNDYEPLIFTVTLNYDAIYCLAFVWLEC